MHADPCYGIPCSRHLRVAWIVKFRTEPSRPCVQHPPRASCRLLLKGARARPTTWPNRPKPEGRHDTSRESDRGLATGFDLRSGSRSI